MEAIGLAVTLLDVVVRASSAASGLYQRYQDAPKDVATLATQLETLSSAIMITAALKTSIKVYSQSSDTTTALAAGVVEEIESSIQDAYATWSNFLSKYAEGKSRMKWSLHGHAQAKDLVQNLLRVQSNINMLLHLLDT